MVQVSTQQSSSRFAFQSSFLWNYTVSFFLQLKVNPDERITASEALRHDWISQGDFVPSLNRKTTLVRLTAFNARRKLKGVVLGLIARKRYGGLFHSILRTAPDCFTVTSVIDGDISGILIRSMNIDYFAMRQTTSLSLIPPVFLNKWRASSRISSYKCKLSRKTPFKSFPFD